MKRITGKAALAAGISAAILAACGGSGSVDTGYGTLGVYLTDAPACGFDNVFVTVDRVRAHRSSEAGAEDGGWIDIPVQLDNPKLDLLELTNGVLAKLGEAQLPGGTYTQLRLVLKPNTNSDPRANSVVPTGAAETALVTPSAVQSGIKLNGNFTVEEGQTTELVLDFDACKSVVRRGNGSFGLKPVISIVALESSGAIRGALDPAVLPSQPVVSAQVNGTIVKSTIPDANGAFSLSPLAAGTYTVVVTSNAHGTDVIDKVPVTVSNDTVISTTAQPLSPEASAFNPVTGTVTPGEAEALLRARQTFAAGPTVTIKYQNAIVPTGDYSMNLPLAAPRYGQYGNGTLPITLTPQAGLAGIYTIEASASGYRTQTADVDVTGGGLVRDFTLAP